MNHNETDEDGQDFLPSDSMAKLGIVSARGANVSTRCLRDCTSCRTSSNWKCMCAIPDVHKSEVRKVIFIIYLKNLYQERK